MLSLIMFLFLYDSKIYAKEYSNIITRNYLLLINFQELLVQVQICI